MRSVSLLLPPRAASRPDCPQLEILAVRLFGHANMGSYDEAINGFLAGRDPQPDVVAYRQPGRVKTGLGVNTEYTFPRLGRVFARRESLGGTASTLT